MPGESKMRLKYARCSRLRIISSIFPPLSAPATQAMIKAILSFYRNEDKGSAFERRARRLTLQNTIQWS